MNSTVNDALPSLPSLSVHPILSLAAAVSRIFHQSALAPCYSVSVAQSPSMLTPFPIWWLSGKVGVGLDRAIRRPNEFWLTHSDDDHHDTKSNLHKKNHRPSSNGVNDTKGSGVSGTSSPAQDMMFKAQRANASLSIVLYFARLWHLVHGKLNDNSPLAFIRQLYVVSSGERCWRVTPSTNILLATGSPSSSIDVNNSLPLISVATSANNLMIPSPTEDGYTTHYWLRAQYIDGSSLDFDMAATSFDMFSYSPSGHPLLAWSSHDNTPSFYRAVRSTEIVAPIEQWLHAFDDTEAAVDEAKSSPSLASTLAREERKKIIPLLEGVAADMQSAASTPPPLRPQRPALPAGALDID
jgi:hypothetical protein